MSYVTVATKEVETFAVKSYLVMSLLSALLLNQVEFWFALYLIPEDLATSSPNRTVIGECSFPSPP